MKTLATLAACLMALLIPSAPAQATNPNYRCDNTASTPYTVDDPSIHIRVGKGDSCYLDGATVHSVNARGGDNLYVIDTEVAHNLMATRFTQNVVIGTAGCKFDPHAGNNVKVVKSHNVAICWESVDNNIMVRQNDGRIRLAHNTAGNNIMVTGNYAYAAHPGDGHHKRIGAIRFTDNVAGNHNRVVRNSGREVIARGNIPAVA